MENNTTKTTPPNENELQENYAQLIRKQALKNAAKYGKAEPGKLIGKIIADDPTLKTKTKALLPLIEQICNQINALSEQERELEIKTTYPELLEPKQQEQKERDLFSFVKVMPGMAITTAFPPDPSKYPHIGHAKAALLNYLFAKKHQGRFILRFEDTNPLLPKLEFYEQFIKDLTWLGIIPDKIVYASDHIDFLYTVIEQFLKDEKAYVCTCSPEKVKESREQCLACECRSQTPADALKAYDALRSKGQEGEGIVRLKIDLSHENTTMRDPTVFRVILTPHPRIGTKYRLWPTYDFQNALLDAYDRVTHRFRSKEFELRNELQGLIQEWAGYPRTQIYEFGRFNITGVPSSGRIIREMIANNQLIGWDDPQLHTLVALRRRGFTPEGICQFLLSTGITKNEAVQTWDDLIVNNKKIVDKTANRYFMVEHPQYLFVQGTPQKQVFLKDHPEKEQRTRAFQINDRFLISQQDFAKLQMLPEGSMVRLMDCLNATKTNEGWVYHSEEYAPYKEAKTEKMIIHWLSYDEPHVSVELFMPDHTIIQGLAEKTINRLQVGDLVQFERVGFCRLDKKEQTPKGEQYTFWFTHK
ncbi:MAG: glutamate--tRNA ligase [Candidatus Woesearchaeota archaeon]